MPTPKLLEQVRNVARMRHLSLSAERAYVGWIRRFILFHNKKHPKEMAEKEIRQFISDLAVNAKISASTQTVALSNLIFWDVPKRSVLNRKTLSQKSNYRTLRVVSCNAWIRFLVRIRAIHEIQRNTRTTRNMLNSTLRQSLKGVHFD